MLRLLTRLVVVLAVCTIGGLAKRRNAQPPPPPPPEFQDLYDLMQTQIDSYDQTILKSWNGTKSPVIFSIQLGSANSNLGVKIVDPVNYIQVQSELDGWKALGAQG